MEKNNRDETNNYKKKINHNKKFFNTETLEFTTNAHKR